MRQLKKQWIAVVMSLILTATAVLQNPLVFAEETETEVKLESILNSETAQELKGIDPADMTEEQLRAKEELDRQIAAQYMNTYLDIEEEPIPSVSEYKNYIPEVRSSLESSYDPRKDSSITVPGIRNQNPLGTCWAHSAMCMVEMNLAKQKYDSSKNNMSEFQTVYFMNHEWKDPLGLCSGDNFHVIDEGGSSTQLSPEWYTRGNNTAYTKFLLMDWVGTVSEAEYDKTEYSKLKENGKDAFLEDEFAINRDAAHVQDVTVANIKKDLDSVKELIKERGAVGISYYSDDNYYKTTKAGTSFYNPQNTSTNHAVTAVGWDDNFDASNFAIAPPGDGAWLVRNSWDTWWGDQGYFWLSYYDTSLSASAYSVLAYPKGDAHYYDHNYQYDGGVCTSVYPYSKGAVEANIFTAQGKEVLGAVSFYTYANYGYKVEIYTDLKDQKDPVSGTLVESATVEGTELYEGYHTVDLAENINLDAGTVFSVVVTLNNKNDGSTYLAVDETFNGGWIYSEAEVSEGQSFCRSSGAAEWKDVGTAWDANLRIKAYTVDNVENPIDVINIREDAKTMKKDGTYDLNASDPESGKNMEYTEPNDDIIIYSSDHEEVAVVDNRGVITAKRAGTAVITAKARVGSGKDSITITVSLEKPAESITLSTDSFVLSKDASKKIDAVMTPADTDDFITWSSSNTAVAAVNSDGNVTGLMEGTAVITAATQSGKKAECTVIVKKRSIEELFCDFDKFPRNIYKYGIYHVTAGKGMKNLSPVKIEWSSSSANVKVTPEGTNGTKGCKLDVENVESSNNRGERVTLTAVVTYLQVSKRGTTTKTRKFKKTTTACNLSYSISLDKNSILFKKKTESVTLNASLNEGKNDDQPTNTRVKWMITDSTGKQDRNGTKVASVNGKGEVKPKGPGITYVTVAAVDSYVKESKSYTVSDTIQVVCTPVSSIDLGIEKINLEVNETVNLKENLVFNQGKSEPYNKDGTKLKWMITDSTGKQDRNGTKVASVNGKGEVKPKGPGVTYVTVFAVDSYVKASKSYTVFDTVQVVCTPVSSIDLDRETVNLKVNETVNLKEKLVFNQGKSEPYNKDGTKLKWMITDSTGEQDRDGAMVVSVNGKGEVKPKGPGVTYVTVFVVDSYVKESKSYTVFDTVQVVCTPVESVGFQEELINLNAEGTVNLKEKLVFNQGKSEPYNKDGMKLNWSSSDRRNVSVDGKGIVKVAKKAAAGSYTITVKATGGVQRGQTVPEGKVVIKVPEQEG